MFTLSKTPSNYTLSRVQQFFKTTGDRRVPVVFIISIYQSVGVYLHISCDFCIQRTVKANYLTERKNFLIHFILQRQTTHHQYSDIFSIRKFVFFCLLHSSYTRKINQIKITDEQQINVVTIFPQVYVICYCAIRLIRTFTVSIRIIQRENIKKVYTTREGTLDQSDF